MDEESILDKVLSSKQVSDIENFNPTETLALLCKDLTPKESDILAARFGLRGHHQQTLEEIGKRFNVTRERVRQIEDAAITKVRSQRRFSESIHPVEELIREVLEAHGGASTEPDLLQALFHESAPVDADIKAVLFFLNELLSDKFDHIGKAESVRDGWKLRGVPAATLREVVQQIVEVFETDKKTMDVDTLLARLHQQPYFQQHPDVLTDVSLPSFLALAPMIGKNPFDEYGLTAWGSIAPRRMHDKIYLVLKKHGSPMHFSEITKRINEAGFDRRVAYPPTVHNELILNDQYVLVGRGMYALQEWGYKPGVVADVLEKILAASDQPMTRDALVEKVLAQRIVKKNTIHLALSDSARFTKLSDGRYTLTKKTDQQAPADKTGTPTWTSPST